MIREHHGAMTINIVILRYAQSLVMGAYSYSQDPGDDVSRYLVTGQS